MNKTNMNFGDNYQLDEEPDGSITTKNQKKKIQVKRFESSKFTHSDMFDPDHGPSETTESHKDEEYDNNGLAIKKDFQCSFGDSSFADRDVIS